MAEVTMRLQFYRRLADMNSLEAVAGKAAATEHHAAVLRVGAGSRIRRSHRARPAEEFRAGRQVKRVHALDSLYAALAQGVSIFDTSMGGMGGCPFITGARGNISTEDTVGMLHGMGLKTGIDLDRLIETSLRFEGVMGQTFPAALTHLKE